MGALGSWSLAAPGRQQLLDDGDFVCGDPPNTATQERGEDEGEEGECDCFVHARPPSRVIDTAPVIRETVPMAPDSKK
jgi:hypothetical protein